MTEDLKNQDTQLVELAIQRTTLLLTVSRKADPEFIYRELFFNVWKKFTEHQRRLTSLTVLETADLEFTVRANGHAEGTLLVKLKGGEDG